MRDPVLYPFYADISSLPGVGPKIRPLLSRLIGGERVLDLLLHLPTGYVDRRLRASIAEAPPGEIVTLRVQVDELKLSRGKWPSRIRVSDAGGRLWLVYFRAQPQWLQKTFRPGAEIFVSGLIQEHDGDAQMLHPDHVAPADDERVFPEVEPVYPMAAGVTSKSLARFVSGALASLRPLEEWIDPHLRRERNWPGFLEALSVLHQPVRMDPASWALARERLAYDEALAREIAIAKARQGRLRRPAPPLPKALGVERLIIESLPYRPTRAQSAAFSDVSADIASLAPMRRLIQGDVGSGKTLIAALAAAQAAASGRLTAIMSPTEVLARQQAEVYSRILAPAGFKCAALTGRDRGAAREDLLRRVRGGEIQVLSGTQALFQSDVVLPELGLVIIDEQHRFGVADRVRLSNKGGSPHMLVMSATPIPRTLALAVHGDLDVSLVTEKPANRQEVSTAAAPDTRIDEVMSAVGRATDRGERAFWICPAVDSEEAGEAAAGLRRERLEEAIGRPVGLVHGRMSATERDTALERFRSGETRALVATTVIEVGVDVPDATIIVIERAEKFGLAQLHQLRGRVGRGEKASSCLLLYHPPLSATARERLDILRRTNDGFEIAEADFRLRGAGDLLGLRQSGTPDFRVLDLVRDHRLLEIARKDAAAILAGDADLTGPRGRAAGWARALFAPAIASMITDGADET
jgi:ATP-dependent DNA helicase RecG